jgi:Protein of unknown function (DUF2567)
MTRAVAAVVAGFAVAGALVGGIWVLVAPPVHGVVALNKSGQRVHVYLGNEADHFFVSAVMMVGLVVAVAVVGAVLVWQWRKRRGPVMVVALVLGAVAAAAAATTVGAGLARLRYGAVNVAAAPVSPPHRVYYVTEAPAVFFGHAPAQALATLLLPAAAAALTYATMVAASAHDDLGVGDGAEPSVPETVG